MGVRCQGQPQLAGPLTMMKGLQGTGWGEGGPVYLETQGKHATATCKAEGDRQQTVVDGVDKIDGSVEGNARRSGVTQ